MSFKIDCPKVIVPTVINMVKLYDTLNTTGVVGIITPGSKHMLPNSTIPVPALLSYCLELDVNLPEDAELMEVSVTLDAGGVTLHGIANSAPGYLKVPADRSAEAITMLTAPTTFKLILARTKVDKPIDQQSVYSYLASRNIDTTDFTIGPVPILPKNIATFRVEDKGAIATIHAEGVELLKVQEMLDGLKPY